MSNAKGSRSGCLIFLGGRCLLNRRANKEVGSPVSPGAGSIAHLKWKSLPRHFPLHPDWPCTARRTFAAFPQLPYIDFQFRDRAAQGIAVHAQLPGRPTLIALVLLQDGQYELLFEFPDSLGIENIASVHLQDQSFELIFHGVSLSIRRLSNSSCHSWPTVAPFISELCRTFSP
jgi:hypothetical protein